MNAISIVKIKFHIENIYFELDFKDPYDAYEFIEKFISNNPNAIMISIEAKF